MDNFQDSEEVNSIAHLFNEEDDNDFNNYFNINNINDINENNRNINNNSDTDSNSSNYSTNSNVNALTALTLTNQMTTISTIDKETEEKNRFNKINYDELSRQIQIFFHNNSLSSIDDGIKYISIYDCFFSKSILYVNFRSLIFFCFLFVIFAIINLYEYFISNKFYFTKLENSDNKTSHNVKVFSTNFIFLFFILFIKIQIIIWNGFLYVFRHYFDKVNFCKRIHLEDENFSAKIYFNPFVELIVQIVINRDLFINFSWYDYYFLNSVFFYSFNFYFSYSHYINSEFLVRNHNSNEHLKDLKSKIRKFYLFLITSNILFTFMYGFFEEKSSNGNIVYLFLLIKV